MILKICWKLKPLFIRSAVPPWAMMICGSTLAMIMKLLQKDTCSFFARVSVRLPVTSVANPVPVPSITLPITSNGNVITLINDNQIGILNAYNLRQIEISKTDKDYEKYMNVKKKIKNKFKWIQYNDFKKYYNKERNVISCLSLDSNSKSYYYKTIKVTNISYFQ